MISYNSERSTHNMNKLQKLKIFIESVLLQLKGRRIRIIAEDCNGQYITNSNI